MAENSIVSDRQNSGEPPTLARHTSMAQGIDAAVQAMKSAAAQPGVDCIFPEAQFDQLSPRNDPVLSPRKSTDLVV